MTVTVVPQAPRTRCFVCGKPEVTQVCHHCGRAMCRDDAPASIPTEKGAMNPEFTQLDLAGAASGEQGVHCPDDVHYYLPRFRWMRSVGAWLAALGVIALSASLVIEHPVVLRALGALGALLGIGLVVASRILERSRYRQEVNTRRPPLPILGKIESVSASEAVRGQISFDATGKYAIEVGQPDGTLTLALQFSSRDQDRLGAYLKKYGLAMSPDLPFHAGFALFKGATDLHLDDASALMPGRVNTIALTGLVGEQPFLSSQGAERSNRWTLRHTYSFLPCDGVVCLPLQIFPTLVQEGAQQAIDLNVQLNPAAATPSLRLQQARVEELTLRVPVAVGKVENTDPVAVFTPAPKVVDGQPLPTTQTITWKNVGMPSTGGRIISKSFYVRFEHNVEPTTVLSGRLRMRFDGTLSGLEDVAFFDALGNHREPVAMQRYTYVDVDFSLDLGGLRFQEIASSQERIVREGVVPGHPVIIALTNAVSEGDFYVKRVIENLPRTSKVDAQILNRYWDVAGRYYDGVYPMDFHLVLTGEEVHGQAALGHPGRTQADVVVQGMVTGEEMRGRVEALRERLAELIQETLAAQPASLPEHLLPYAQAPAAEPTISPMAPPRVAQPEMVGRVKELDDLLKKLDMALLEGRVSEARYDEMRARYEQEKAGLGGSA